MIQKFISYYKSQLPFIGAIPPIARTTCMLSDKVMTCATQCISQLRQSFLAKASRNLYQTIAERITGRQTQTNSAPITESSRPLTDEDFVPNSLADGDDTFKWHPDYAPTEGSTSWETDEQYISLSASSTPRSTGEQIEYPLSTNGQPIEIELVDLEKSRFSTFLTQVWQLLQAPVDS